MASFTDLSFEGEGSAAGTPAGWTWTRSIAAFLFASFASSSGVSRFETFLRGWGADTFSDTLTVDNSASAVFAGSPATKFESFEQLWRMPETPAPDGTHPGNETAIFAWDRAVAGVFGTPATVFDSYEQGWGVDSPIFTYNALDFTIGAFVSSGNADSFETHWKSNETAISTFDPGDLTIGTFSPGAVNVEDFESVKADQAFSVDPSSSIITCPAHGYSNGDIVGFRNAGTGRLPSGLNADSSYFVIGSTTNTLQVSLVSGGSATPISDTGSGTNEIHGDPSIFWTLTDVGV